ncbi:arylamine N-acetyltransferase [Bacillus aerolatus]|uniref:Arylamine N-acetyltransferase n=1 Tax=Bacillus aerolatus TaxID=2653354 RepID=A0A6I1FI13_9BACI|nr:arylamine N-acetyltransferase [Bacillus aerolatus]KAB7705322.1 arylamine N-acetyltransferase [Bacillus aerolatus]
MKRLVKELKETGYMGMQTPVEQVAFVLRKFAEWFPFENVDVMRGNKADITPEFLTDKMVVKRRGGLCYEINPLLLLVLKTLGFEAELGAATVYNEGKWGLHRTHAIVLLRINGENYIADSGFGSRLALSPLPLDGDEVTSPAGTFRLRTHATEKGSIAMESLSAQGDWTICYVFDWKTVPWNELSKAKRNIHENPRSPFNKQLLIATILPDGTQSINEERRHRKWKDGHEETSPFENKQALIDSVRLNCSSSLAEAVENYTTPSQYQPKKH